MELGVSAVELRAQPVELFLGSPAAIAGRGGAARDRGGGQAPAARGRGGRRRRGGGGGRRQPWRVTAHRRRPRPRRRASGGGRGGGRAARRRNSRRPRAAAEETRKWRTGVSLDKVKEFRKKWEDAGVLIEIVKWDGIFEFSDDEIDYASRCPRRWARGRCRARSPSARPSARPVRRQAQDAGRLPRSRRHVAGGFGKRRLPRRSTTPPTSTSDTSSPARTCRPLPFIKKYHGSDHARAREGSQAATTVRTCHSDKATRRSRKCCS